MCVCMCVCLCVGVCVRVSVYVSCRALLQLAPAVVNLKVTFSSSFCLGSSTSTSNKSSSGMKEGGTGPVARGEGTLDGFSTSIMNLC